ETGRVTAKEPACDNAPNAQKLVGGPSEPIEHIAFQSRRCGPRIERAGTAGQEVSLQAVARTAPNNYWHSRMSSRLRWSRSKSNCLMATASALSQSGASTVPICSPLLRMMMTCQPGGAVWDWYAGTRGQHSGRGDGKRVSGLSACEISLTAQ